MDARGEQNQKNLRSTALGHTKCGRMSQIST